MIGAAQVVVLDPSKGERIAAVQVLPTEPQHTGAKSLGHPQCVEGGEVVGFLVHVHDVRREGAQPPFQPWVEMQVETAAESDGFDDQFVASSVGSLNTDGAAAVVPQWRHDDHEFDIWEAGDFLQFALVGPHQTGFGDHKYAHRCSIATTCRCLTSTCIVL
jgi:hypothetical protein